MFALRRTISQYMTTAHNNDHTSILQMNAPESSTKSSEKKAALMDWPGGIISFTFTYSLHSVHTVSVRASNHIHSKKNNTKLQEHHSSFLTHIHSVLLSQSFSIPYPASCSANANTHLRQSPLNNVHRFHVYRIYKALVPERLVQHSPLRCLLYVCVNRRCWS